MASALRGKIVAFSGLDGSGKSSQSHLLLENLRRSGIGAEIEWVPVAINPSIGHIKRSVKMILRLLSLPKAERTASAKGDGNESGVDPGKALVQQSPLVRHVWATTVTLANVISHWRVFLRHVGNEKVVIFDRYALDTAVRLQTWYGHLGSVRFETWLIRALSPKAMCSYLLDVPGATALGRKQDRWDLDVLERQARVYREECERFGVRRLDGERPAEELAAEVAREVRSCLAFPRSEGRRVGVLR